MTIFPFLISYDKITTFLLNLSNNMPVSTDTAIICYILINFINIWFIIKILEIFIKTFKKIINTLF